MENVHEVSTRVPIDALVGDEMVIFRSSRGAKKHDGVRKGQRVRISSETHGWFAAGTALASARVYAFRDIPEADIRDGYYAQACTRQSLLKCLKEMYGGKYDEDTETTVIRVLRTE